MRFPDRIHRTVCTKEKHMQRAALTWLVTLAVLLSPLHAQEEVGEKSSLT
jgi:hypothetical protein